ncbi:MAG TPA: hypothetical protein VMH26_08415 [Burkholderiales bacterium]|nr:hypothetical protein [Burkholderiales bacterium]
MNEERIGAGGIWQACDRTASGIWWRASFDPEVSLLAQRPV